MDDDIKPVTIQVAGETYRFKPLDDEELGRLQTLSIMGVSGLMQTKALFATLRKSLGEDAWDGFADRTVSGEIDVVKELPRITKKLMERFARDSKASKDAKASSDEA